MTLSKRDQLAGDQPIESAVKQTSIMILSSADEISDVNLEKDLVIEESDKTQIEQQIWQKEEDYLTNNQD